MISFRGLKWQIVARIVVLSMAWPLAPGIVGARKILTSEWVVQRLPRSKPLPKQLSAERWAKGYFGSKTLKVQIELEGPGKQGLDTAMCFLELSDYLREGKTQGSFEDTELQVKGSWKLVP